MTDDNSSDRSFGEVTENPDDNEQVSEEVEEVSEESKEEVTEEKKEVAPEADTKEGESTEPETQLTEKGTKLDPNPQSAVHQQLANERRIRSQYEQVLTNPQLLSQYMKNQFGETKVEPQQVKEYKAEDFENLDDVANVVNSLQKDIAEKSKTYEEKISQLNNIVGALTGQGRAEHIISNIEKETQTISKLPEFDKNSPDYVEGLEERVVKKFHELDFDANTGFFRGQHSIAQVAQDAIENIQLGRKSGSLKAQTVIKQKSEGKIKVSPKVDESADEDNLSAADSIAKGIAKLGLR